MDRLVVVELRHRHVAPVGVLSFARVPATKESGSSPWLVLPLSFSIAAPEVDDTVWAVPSLEQDPPTLGIASTLPGASEGERARTNDFVAGDVESRVALHAHGHATSMQPTREIAAAIRHGDETMVIHVAASESTRAIPLSRAYRRDVASSLPTFARLVEGAVIELAHLSFRGDRRRIRLPSIVPSAIVLPDLESSAAIAPSTLATTLSFQCTSLSLDADRERLVLGFRARLPAATTRVAVWLASASSSAAIERPRLADALRELSRGHFTLALEPIDVDPLAPLDVRSRQALEAELSLHRHATLEHPGEPTLTLERYALVAAELTERREPRAVTLARHDLDEHRFTIEELAWLDKIANAVMAGDATLAEELGRRTLEAQDRLAAPEEAARTIDEWITIRAEIMVYRDAAPVLSRHSLSLPAWLRIDRRFTRTCDEDPPLARVVEQRMEQLRLDLEAAMIEEQNRTEKRER